MREKPHQQLIYLPSADADALAECLVALANADGGLIVLSLDDNGKPADEIWDEEAEGLCAAAVMQCRPPVVTRWQRIEAPHGDLIGIQIPRSADLHTPADGQVLVREGAKIGRSPARHCASLPGIGPLPNTKPKPFPVRTATTYRPDHRRIPRQTRGAWPLQHRLTDQLLFEIGATDRDNNPTVAGTLLFSAKPHIFSSAERRRFRQVLRNRSAWC